MAEAQAAVGEIASDVFGHGQKAQSICDGASVLSKMSGALLLRETAITNHYRVGMRFFQNI